MQRNYWKYLTFYLLAGLLWGSYCAYENAKRGNYGPDYAINAPKDVLINAAIWPISVSMGLYVIATGH